MQRFQREQEIYMTKIATVLGARPQFIKASVVSRALRSTAGVHEILIHTGQHFDPEMSDIFFKELEIPMPDHHRLENCRDKFSESDL